MTAAQQSQRSRESWEGEQAAIYCRISHIKDKDQTSVERQERICRDIVDSRAGWGPGLAMRRLRLARMPSVSGRAQTRSGIARTKAGMTAIGVLPVSLWSLACCPPVCLVHHTMK